MANRREQLKKLKELREAGSTRLHEYQITEAQFKELNKRAALEEDFVVDDNGEGYAGRIEDWDHKDSDMSDMSEDENNPRAKKKKKKAKAAEMFASKPKKKVQRPQPPPQTTANDNELLGDIFNSLDKQVPTIEKKTPLSKISTVNSKREVYKTPSIFSRNPKIKVEPSESLYNNNSMDVDVGMDIESSIPETEVKFEPNVVKVKSLQTKSSSIIKTDKFLPKFEKEELKMATVVSAAKNSNDKDWKTLNIPLANPSNDNENSTKLPDSSSSQILEEGSLYVFWIDAYEKNGTIYLFGKTFDSNQKKYVSVCILVKNMSRNLFVLPRLRKLDSSGQETDVDVDIAMVYEEFDNVRRKHNISHFSSKVVSRKYAFELPNIPIESDYLKVLYPYSDSNTLPTDLSGSTFSHIFGTNTRALELFLIKRKLMGPCWIKVNNPTPSPTKLSWCKLELVVENPKQILNCETDPSAPKAAPPLVVMSISLRTVMNENKNSNEIVAVSGLIYNNVNMDASTPEANGLQFSAVRPLADIPIPVGFSDAIKALPSRVEILPNERALLSFLLGTSI